MRRLYGDLESNSVYREMRASNMASAAEEAKVTYTYDIHSGWEGDTKKHKKGRNGA